MPERIGTLELKSCEICGAGDFSHCFREVEGKQACRNCWMKYRESNGLTKKGCINPDSVVCPHRKPAIIDKKDFTASPEMMEQAFASAVCYIGHEECIQNQKEAQKMLELIQSALDGETTFCPDCGSKISVVKSSRSAVAYCPTHGMIWHAALKPEGR